MLLIIRFERRNYFKWPFSRLLCNVQPTYVTAPTLQSRPVNLTSSAAHRAMGWPLYARASDIEPPQSVSPPDIVRCEPKRLAVDRKTMQGAGASILPGSAASMAAEKSPCRHRCAKLSASSAGIQFWTYSAGPVAESALDCMHALLEALQLSLVRS